jgi:hypothetical protein
VNSLRQNVRRWADRLITQRKAITVLDQHAMMTDLRKEVFRLREDVEILVKLHDFDLRVMAQRLAGRVDATQLGALRKLRANVIRHLSEETRSSFREDLP